MKSIQLTPLLLSVALALPCSAHEAPNHEHAELVPIPEYNPPFGQAGAAASLKAAEVFLASFDETTREEIVFDLDAPERASWSNLPARYVTRAGISISELSDDQRKLLFGFLASSLSREGYLRIMDALAAEAFLGDAFLARWRGWSPENYWISFYGMPSAASPWGWQFGGHHLALNVSADGNLITAMSPSFIGTEPATFRYKGVEYETVTDMHRAGYALFSALDGSQKAAADAGTVPEKLRTGPGKDGVVPAAIGLSGAEMTGRQRALLLATIGHWVSIQPSENADRRIAAIEAELDRTYFAWAGAGDVDTHAYMIIQGPTVIVEFLSTDSNVRGGQGHYHTVYRNPQSEYGGHGP